MITKLLRLSVLALTLSSSSAWASLQSTGRDSFKYTANDGTEKSIKITGFTRFKNAADYLKSSAFGNSREKSTTPPQGAGYEVSSLSCSPQAAGNMTLRDLKHDQELKGPVISTIYAIRFGEDTTNSNSIGFIIVLANGTKLLNFEYHCSVMGIKSGYYKDKTIHQALSDMQSQGSFLGVSASNQALSYWHAPEDFEQTYLNRFKVEESHTLTATILLEHFIVSGAGVINIPGLGQTTYTITEQLNL
ncbi:hypothetical protein GZ77_21180 [Endozoicomonas montiporae]|uniref:Uncharacterized protein n=2 Tax=Endozoicomonas montiporae TaxID=1027273 RepID=A0A081N3C4_9GAMM|nr:hypothetical protein [Endozoicomonas montiporae]AMO58244.1 hypothetical protein EZMO1_4327 [Endozoicomonas montiporae CL-33]KEQ12947.1 hypothetical protein GZ77_21180 [Endozoicomonas montiporae]